MTPLRTEDDLHTLFAEDAADVCSSAEMLSRVARRRRRRPVWLPAVAACAAVLVVAVIVVALTRDGTDKQPTPSVGTAVPGTWRTVVYPTFDVTMKAPPEWRSYQYADSSGLRGLIGYLSTASLHAPCVRTGSTTTCNGPLSRQAPDDVLVAWWAGSPARTPGISNLGGGTHTVLGGRPAVITVTQADEACAAAGGATSVYASIGGSIDPDSPVAYRMQACVGADADKSAVLTMLHTVRFNTHPVTATIVGKLLAVGGPAPGTARPLPGTVIVRASTSEISVPVRKTGQYSVQVPPGTYELEGHSPLYGSGTYACRALKPVTPAANATATANVYCQEA